ncbi:Protein of unknown function [Faunimonas pinastri]|uniref:DUF2628 domain-containing protein n=1 Tax=Faunimonas pinastri TaxID=1855383 RepID=A0A1H9GP13_9HYPH|nr:DUF2628 domain-containing protein [Faunimonas pinastri]SEQ51773.1 Protein of unknown function [Faunimonas pinastri]
MKIFTIHTPPGTTGDVPLSAGEAERVRFVKDGFSWPAFFFGFLWFLWHRLWLGLLGYVVYLVLLGVLAQFTGGFGGILIAFLAKLFLGFQANEIRRWSLRRRGWRETGGIAAGSLGEAEVRYFARPASSRATVEEEASASSNGAPPPVRPPLSIWRGRADEDNRVVGLFPEAEG